MTAIEYLEASGVPESMWPTFKDWYNWFKRNDLVGVAKDGDTITGVALARCSNSAQAPKQIGRAHV